MSRWPHVMPPDAEIMPEIYVNPNIQLYLDNVRASDFACLSDKLYELTAWQDKEKENAPLKFKFFGLDMIYVEVPKEIVFKCEMYHPPPDPDSAPAVFRFYGEWQNRKLYEEMMEKQRAKDNGRKRGRRQKRRGSGRELNEKSSCK